MGHSHLAGTTMIGPDTPIASHLFETRVLIVSEETVKLLVVCLQILTLAKQFPPRCKPRVPTFNSDTVLGTVCVHKFKEVSGHKNEMGT